MINCVIELDFSWSEEYIISERSKTPEVVEDNPVNKRLTIREKIQINNTKLYVSVIILSLNDNIKFLENARQGFKRTSFGTNRDLK